MREVIYPEEAARRLDIIFPRSAFDSVLSSRLAGWAVASLLYVDAVAGEVDGDAGETWARPSTVTWQQMSVLENHDNEEDRVAWREAALLGQRQLRELLEKWGERHDPQYRENSRETLRDETFKKWQELSAMRRRAGLPTSSSKPTWALEPHFAELFDPSLDGDALEEAIAQWTTKHMNPGHRLRAQLARQQAVRDSAVSVTLPSGDVRTLEPGKSSEILKGVVEQWAPLALSNPVVLTISEPGAKLLVSDELLLARVGLKIDISNVLPDALVADVDTDPVEFWLVEAVATDGVISDGRKSDLVTWAERQGIQAGQCRFLTAFESRGAAIAKRRLKDLGSGTFAWFLDEPGHTLYWDELQ